MLSHCAFICILGIMVRLNILLICVLSVGISFVLLEAECFPVYYKKD